MGDLADDTVVEGRGGRYRARLSDEWRLWGPSGGYIATIALRAAAEESRLSRPASFYCHYLSVGQFDDVDLAVTPIRAGKRAESLRVSMTQRDRPILEAMVWMVDGLEGIVHDASPVPEVPPPEEVLSWEEHFPDGEPPYPFWHHVDNRLIGWPRGLRWEDRAAGEPVRREWWRYRPRPTFDDPIVDAARALVAIDTLLWPAATLAHSGEMEYFAPSLDVAVQFHRQDPASEWLLVEARSSVADRGLVGGTAAVWSATGRLLASGGQQMLCLPGSSP